MLTLDRKTQIALEYVYRLRDQDPDLSIFWVSAGSAETFRQSYASVARECHIPGHDSPLADVLNLLKKWLEDGDNGRWLLVADNADDIESAGLFDYIPSSPLGSVLVTTRNRDFASRFTRLHVAGMDQEESAQLLLAGLEDSPEPNDLSTLASRLDGVPLALAQVSASIQRSGMSAGDYLRRVDRFQLMDRPELSAKCLIDFSEVQEQSILAIELLSVMAFFDPNAIPQTILSSYHRWSRSGEPLATEFNDDDLEKAMVHALHVLASFALISRDSHGDVRIHSLIQSITRSWLQSRRMEPEFAGRALLTLSNIYPLANFENWRTCEKYHPHVIAILRWKGTGSQQESEKKASLLHRAAMFLLFVGRWGDAETAELQAIELQSTIFGRTHRSTLAGETSLVSIYESQGRWKEAESLAARVVKTKQATLGPDDPDTLASMADLASIFRNQGRWKEAELLQRDEMDGRIRVLGGDMPDTLVSMGNLALTLRKQGRLEEAKSLQQNVVTRMKEVLGDDHPLTLGSMSNLASIFLDQGQLGEAESLNVSVLGARMNPLQDEGPDTLANLASLAVIYNRQGRLKEAEVLDTQVVEISQRVLGKEHPNTLTSMTNLASTLLQQGRLKEAESLEEQVVAVKKAKLGDKHLSTLSSMANLASIYSTQGKFEKAELLDKEILLLRKAQLGEDHPDTLNSMANLVATYWSQGRWAEAEELGARVVGTRKRILGPENPSTLTSMANLASTYASQGRWKQAEELELQVMETSKRVLGEGHPHTLTSMNNVAFNWMSQGRTLEAIELMRKCAHLRGRTLGPDHPSTVSSFSTLHAWEEASGNP